MEHNEKSWSQYQPRKPNHHMAKTAKGLSSLFQFQYCLGKQQKTLLVDLLSNPNIIAIKKNQNSNSKNNYYRNIKKFFQNKLIKIKNENEIEFTIKGVVCALASKFNVSLFEMYFLVEAYSRIYGYRKDNSNIDYYDKFTFSQIFEYCYSYASVSQILSFLCEKGLIYKRHKAAYSIYEHVYKKLEQYHDLILQIDNWIFETKLKKEQLIKNDPKIAHLRETVNTMMQHNK